MIINAEIGKESEGGTHGLFKGIIMMHEETEENHEKIQLEYQVAWPIFGPGTS